MTMTPKPPRILIIPSRDGTTWDQAFIIPEGMPFPTAESLIKTALDKAKAKNPDEWNIDDVFEVLETEGQGIQGPSEKEVTTWCWD
jgi:hypothetical protein